MKLKGSILYLSKVVLIQSLGLRLSLPGLRFERVVKHVHSLFLLNELNAREVVAFFLAI